MADATCTDPESQKLESEQERVSREMGQMNCLGSVRMKNPESQDGATWIPHLSCPVISVPGKDTKYKIHKILDDAKTVGQSSGQSGLFLSHASPKFLVSFGKTMRTGWTTPKPLPIHEKSRRQVPVEESKTPYRRQDEQKQRRSETVAATPPGTMATHGNVVPGTGSLGFMANTDIGTPQ
ncbi:hypothetical protein STEG23_010830 [Scotinomys teguina]